MSIKQRALYLFHSAISRFWVRPLEDRVIPVLERKNGRVSKNLLRWASWWANAGRVMVNEMRLLKKRWMGPDWSVTYIGNGTSFELLCHHLFPTSPQDVETTQVFLWQVPSLVKKHAEEGDLVICELNKILHISPLGIDLAFTTPSSVFHIVHGIDRPLDEILPDFQPHLRQRIRKFEAQGYSYAPTHSEADFNLFYHRMYLPYVHARFTGRNATLHDFDYVHGFFHSGILIQVQKDQEPIAAGVCQLIGDTCRAYFMGVLEGRDELLRQGSNVALWWSVLLWGRQQGARHYNLGTTIPITANGVFTFKQHWGAQVYLDNSSKNQISYFGISLSSPLRKHLNNLGFITEKDGKLFRVLLHDPAEPVDEAMLADQLYHAARSGLAGIIGIPQGGKRQLIPLDAFKQDPTGKRYMIIHPFSSP